MFRKNADAKIPDKAVSYNEEVKDVVKQVLKIDNEEKITIHQLYKAGKLKLINDHEEPDMEPSDYFDEYFMIND